MANQNHDDGSILFQEILDDAISSLRAKCRIHKVHNGLLKLNSDAYTTKVVSICPFHHDNPRLKNMESLKLKYYKDFRVCVRANFDDLVSLGQQLEPKVSLYYSEDIQLSWEKLVELILMDSCFIFEFILTSTSTDDDCVPFKCWLESNIAYDLLLLENQLPFDVLDKLYNLASPSPDFLLFADLTFHLFWIPYGDSPPSIKHFTYILRISYLSPTDSLSPRMDEVLTQLYNATELKEAGIKFREGGMDENTESYLRNMMALEELYCPIESCNTPLATDHVIIVYDIKCSYNHNSSFKNTVKFRLGDNSDVAKFFSGLGNNIVLLKCNSDYIRILAELNAYYERPWNNARASLRCDYCRSPWKMTNQNHNDGSILFKEILDNAISPLRVNVASIRFPMDYSN
ncbi:UPF0481 protein At3g47200-like [Gastrolobium bilobum]|uniref:UPF0481 protein At3g47200-like n=1 Tax=Gastrolobium bilobum TaxID=150636 RepID=UPI002AAF7526|nr:UPF0481 protein At3g47200-like [Gastrolobium bilobum]